MTLGTLLLVLLVANTPNVPAALVAVRLAPSGGSRLP
jgi:hypothetical protein